MVLRRAPGRGPPGAALVLQSCLVALVACAAPAGGTAAAAGGGASRSLLAALGPSARVAPEGEPWVEVLSWHPRAFLHHNFLSAAEADHIVATARPLMRRSTVVGAGGAPVLDQVRTSFGCFLKRNSDPVLAAVEARVAAWTHLNASHQEDTQVLRYSPGQEYGAHYDSLVEATPRCATVLLYLSDTESGGETAFPAKQAAWLDPGAAARLGPFSPCAAGHVAARPRKGDALLFWSLGPDGATPDPAAMHTGCPVLKGLKWTATKWIHTAPFRPEELERPPEERALPAPEDCRDAHDQCREWADAGECDKNPGFMRGNVGSLGECRAACGECEPCAAGDAACGDRNRVRAGYLPLSELTAEAGGGGAAGAS